MAYYQKTTQTINNRRFCDRWGGICITENLILCKNYKKRKKNNSQAKMKNSNKQKSVPQELFRWSQIRHFHKTFTAEGKKNTPETFYT